MKNNQKITELIYSVGEKYGLAPLELTDEKKYYKIKIAEMNNDCVIGCIQLKKGITDSKEIDKLLCELIRNYFWNKIL